MTGTPAHAVQFQSRTRPCTSINSCKPEPRGMTDTTETGAGSPPDAAKRSAWPLVRCVSIRIEMWCNALSNRLFQRQHHGPVLLPRFVPNILIPSEPTTHPSPAFSSCLRLSAASFLHSSSTCIVYLSPRILSSSLNDRLPIQRRPK